MRLFPCAVLFVCQVNIFRGDREIRCFWRIVRCRETDRVREVGNYVHSWRPLYGFGVRLFLRLWYRCLWHVDRGPAARFVYRTMLCFLRRHNTFGRVYVFTPTTCRAWSCFSFTAVEYTKGRLFVPSSQPLTNRIWLYHFCFSIAITNAFATENGIFQF